MKATMITTSGKRKRAVARATIVEGSGNVTINKKNYNLLKIFDKLKIQEPIKIAEQILGKINFDVSINARGGGEKGQIEASRLALARAILKFSKSKLMELIYRIQGKIDFLSIYLFTKIGILHSRRMNRFNNWDQADMNPLIPRSSFLVKKSCINKLTYIKNSYIIRY